MFHLRPQQLADTRLSHMDWHEDADIGKPSGPNAQAPPDNSQPLDAHMYLPRKFDRVLLTKFLSIVAMNPS